MKFYLLFLVLLIAAGIRIYKVTEVPTGFFTDEASVGVNAYTILTKGTDQYGERFPFFFKSFGEYKGGLPIYTAVPFLLLFGPTEFAVRLNSVFFGILSILAVYLISMELFKRHPKRAAISIFSSLFLAISPWHIHYSRVGWDGYMQFVFLVSMGVYFFLKAQEKPKLLPLSIAIFGIATYSYFAARIFIPLFGLALFFLHFRFFWQNKKYSIISLFVLFVILLPFVHHHLRDEAWSTYWKGQSIFLNPQGGQSTFFHITQTYLSHFSPDFLFTKGHIGMPNQGINRHSVRGMGELYLFQLPLIIFGLFALWKKEYRAAFAIILAWLLLYPVAASLTTEHTATSTRSIIGVVPFQILSAVGLLSFLMFVSNTQKSFYKVRLKEIIYWSVLVACLIILSFSFVHYLKLFFVEYPGHSSDFWGWQYGSRDIIEYFISVQDKYDGMVMFPEFNGPENLIQFYSGNYDKGCTQCLVGGFDKLVPGQRQLFALPEHRLNDLNENQSFEIHHTIYYPYNQYSYQGNGTQIAFIIGEVKSKNGTST